MTTTVLAGIARAAVLADLTIAVYSGKRKDKDTQDEVIASKGAQSKQAASVYKSLFAGSKEAAAITTVASKARQDHYRLTLPWDDKGLRLLPTARMHEYERVMAKHKADFEAAVETFLCSYDNMVRKALFELGQLFRREDYPSLNGLRRRYSFDVQVTPLPTSGDFRLDIEREVQSDIVRRYDGLIERRLQEASRDAWNRVHGVLTRMVDRLTAEGADGKRARIHDSMLEQAHDVVELLKDFNLTGDHQLETARLRLADAIDGMTTDTLRESSVARQEVAAKAKATLDAFEWHNEDDEDDTYDGALPGFDQEAA